MQRLFALFESKIRTGVTREEAQETFIGLGMMDTDGNFISPYGELLARLFAE